MRSTVVPCPYLASEAALRGEALGSRPLAPGAGQGGFPLLAPLFLQTCSSVLYKTLYSVISGSSIVKPAVLLLMAARCDDVRSLPRPCFPKVTKGHKDTWARRRLLLSNTHMTIANHGLPWTAVMNDASPADLISAPLRLTAAGARGDLWRAGQPQPDANPRGGGGHLPPHALFPRRSLSGLLLFVLSDPQFTQSLGRSGLCCRRPDR